MSEVIGYAATHYTKNGRELFTTFGYTAEDAARELFAAQPTCKTASICDARHVGQLIIKRHANIRWIDRASVKPYANA